MLVDLESTAWVAIALPPSFGQHSAQSIAAEYEEAVDDLPRPLLDAVLNGKYRKVFPPSALSLPKPTEMASLEGVSITTILDRHLFFLHNLVAELRGVFAVMDDVILGFDWTHWRRTQVTTDADPFYFVDITQTSQSLTPMGVQLLRSVVRMRTACVDWRRVSSDFEELLELAGQVLQGKRSPEARMDDHDLRELDAQKSAWESAFLEISLDWFILLRGADANDFISWDRKRRQENKKARVTGQQDLFSQFKSLNIC